MHAVVAKMNCCVRRNIRAVDRQQWIRFLCNENSMTKTFLMAAGALLLVGCVTPGQKTTQQPTPIDTRECAQNFTFDGSFWTGRTFKTHAVVNNVSQATGMQRAGRYLATGGWTITN